MTEQKTSPPAPAYAIDPEVVRLAALLLKDGAAGSAVVVQLVNDGMTTGNALAVLQAARKNPL